MPCREWQDYKFVGPDVNLDAEIVLLPSGERPTLYRGRPASCDAMDGSYCAMTERRLIWASECCAEKQALARVRR